MSLIDWAIHLVDVGLFFLLGEKWLRKTTTGERLMSLFESGIANLVQARADAELRSEVSALQKFFIWVGSALIPVMLLTSYFEFLTLHLSLAIIFITAMFGAASLEWTFQHRVALRSFLSLRAIVILVLTLVAMVLAVKPMMDPHLVFILRTLGLTAPSEGLIYVLFIGLLAGAFLFMYLSLWVMCGSVSFLIVGLIYAASCVSRLLVRSVTKDLAWQLAFLTAVLIRLTKPFLR
jgi:hypothetical protein